MSFFDFTDVNPFSRMMQEKVEEEEEEDTTLGLYTDALFPFADLTTDTSLTATVSTNTRQTVTTAAVVPSPPPLPTTPGLESAGEEEEQEDEEAAAEPTSDISTLTPEQKLDNLSISTKGSFDMIDEKHLEGYEDGEKEKQDVSTKSTTVTARVELEITHADKPSISDDARSQPQRSTATMPPPPPMSPAQQQQAPRKRLALSESPLGFAAAPSTGFELQPRRETAIVRPAKPSMKVGDRQDADRPFKPIPGATTTTIGTLAAEHGRKSTPQPQQRSLSQPSSTTSGAASAAEPRRGVRPSSPPKSLRLDKPTIITQRRPRSVSPTSTASAKSVVGPPPTVVPEPQFKPVSQHVSTPKPASLPPAPPVTSILKPRPSFSQENYSPSIQSTESTLGSFKSASSQISREETFRSGANRSVPFVPMHRKEESSRMKQRMKLEAAGLSSDNFASLEEMKKTLSACEEKLREKKQLLLREEVEFKQMKAEMVHMYLSLSQSLAKMLMKDHLNSMAELDSLTQSYEAMQIQLEHVKLNASFEINPAELVASSSDNEQDDAMDVEYVDIEKCST